MLRSIQMSASVSLQVWKSFNCKSLKEYLLLYLKTDVLLLGCVFEAFRETALQQYGLDPAHFVSAPHLSWIAMLKYTRVRIEARLLFHTFMYTDQLISFVHFFRYCFCRYYLY